jgi:hypothetical protein
MKEKIKIILITAIIGFFILVTMTIFVNRTTREHLVFLFMFCIFVFYIGYEKIKKRIKK